MSLDTQGRRPGGVNATGVIPLPPAAYVCVLSEDAKPLNGAVVTFVDVAGATDAEVARPCASARANFVPTSATVTLRGFIIERVTVSQAVVSVTLARVLATIGTATVGTGSRSTLHDSPLATSLLDREAIASSPATTTDRLLRELPGSDRVRSNSAFTNYGQLRASFSGAGSDRGAVFVDGVPAQDGFGGQVDWQAYPAATIERMELLRGAGSSLYGSGAIGGVLDITTFGPLSHTDRADRTAGTIAFDTGTSDAAAMHIALRGPLAGKLSASLEGTSARYAYADLAPGYTTSIDRVAKSTSGTFAARVRYDDAKTTIAAALDASSDHQDEGRPNYTFDRSLRQRSLSATRTFASAFARVAYYARDTTVENLSDVFPGSPGALRYDQHVPTHEEGFTATYAYAKGPATLQLRIDERRVAGISAQNGTGGVFQALGAGSQVARGVAVQTGYRTTRFEIDAGARADTIRYDDLVQSLAATPAPVTSTVAGHAESAISPRIAVRYDVGPRLALRASAGGGFRGPYLNELVRGFSIGKIFQAPNLNLRPERSATTSAGADYLFGVGRVALDIVETRVRDAISFVTLSPTLAMRENFNRTQSDSETLSYVAPISSCARFRVSGTLQHATVTNGPAGTIGKSLSYVPDAAADVALDANGRAGFGYGIDVAYAGQTYADDVQAQPLGAAVLLGASLHATTVSGTTFTLFADNLTRQRYLSSIDRYGPPQAAALRVTVPIGPAQTDVSGCR